MNKNKKKEDDIKKCTHYDQYQKPWYKKNQDRWEVKQKYFYLSH